MPKRTKKWGSSYKRGQEQFAEVAKLYSRNKSFIVKLLRREKKFVLVLLSHLKL
jgi:hypothetical protein